MPPVSTSPANLPLRDIHLPPEVSWWPPAPGWSPQMLTLILLPAVAYALRQRWQRRDFRRLAIRQLEEIERKHQERPNHQRLLQNLPRLLRQAALQHFPQSDCAGLVGEKWLKFLDRNLDDKPFSQGAGRQLAEGPYLPQTEHVDAEALLSLCGNWLRQLPPAPKSTRGLR